MTPTRGLGLLLTVTVAAGATASTGRPAAAAPHPGGATTPIHHLIVVIGENRTYDNVFATWTPPHGHAHTLLSEGIVTAAGACGAHAGLARQQQATESGAYRLDPQRSGPYPVLPQPNTTTAKGQPPNVPDTRFPATLPNCPYRITQYVPYTAYTGDPIHRFYQMWQQHDEGRNDLYVWTAQTAGFDNGAAPPQPIHQGALQMGYYSIAQGDAPVMRFLADHYASSDNYHQAVMGGTGANHIALGTGDAAAYLDASGHPTTPPQNQIENPDAKPGTNNNFSQDGYSGGSFSDCADRRQPGVGAIRAYLDRTGAFRDGDCAPNTYYLLNNYDPGYLPDGTAAPIGPTHFTVPPQRFRTVGDALNDHGISWGYYAVGWNHGSPTAEYCTICDPMQYATSIMTSATQRANLHGYDDFTAAVTAGSLPAVSLVKPGDDDGHPGYSTLPLFEGFTRDVVNRVLAQPKLAADTAIVITFDEGGGYYDSGYIQPVSFFGDGPRIPMLVISPWSREGEVDHTYADHVSVLKFIERNWGLGPLSERSLDNLPNPHGAGYRPDNTPAIGDLMGLFHFSHRHPTPPIP